MNEHTFGFVYCILNEVENLSCSLILLVKEDLTLLIEPVASNPVLQVVVSEGWSPNRSARLYRGHRWIRCWTFAGR